MEANTALREVISVREVMPVKKRNTAQREVMSLRQCSTKVGKVIEKA